MFSALQPAISLPALSARSNGRDVELFVGRFIAQVPQGWSAAETPGGHGRRQQGPKEKVPSRSSVVGHVDSINPGAANRYNLSMTSPTRRDLLAASALLLTSRLRALPLADLKLGITTDEIDDDVLTAANLEQHNFDGGDPQPVG